MANVVVKVLEPAEHFGFMSLEEARITGQAADIGDDALRFMIDQNSSIVATLCNRVFAKEKVRETWRCLGEPCDCADAAATRRIFLTRWPVKEEDIEAVISGYTLLPPGAWELDENAGVLTLWSTAEPVVITYTGGYELPDEAPAALKYAAALLVRQDQADAQTQAMAGIRMIAHKEKRIVYHQAGTTQTTAAKTGGTSPTLDSVKNLLAHFRRNWI